MLVKRLIDLVLVGLTLPLFIPLMLACAALIRLDSPGPILFWSTRVGRGGQEFSMPKFRSMREGTPVIDTEAMTRLSATNFVTPTGAWLRRYSLDELPQVWSVLRGDMSIVGYRPALPTQVYLNNRRDALSVHALRPGITGLAQVKGRDLLTDEQKADLDSEYVENWSLALDLRILLATVYHVVSSNGVSH